MRALVRGDRPPIDGVAEVVPGDLDDAEAIRRLVEGAALCIHNAGLVRARSRDAFMRVNRDGAQAMAAATPAETPFVLVSSLAATQPAVSPYAASKAAAEAAALQARPRGATAIVRPPAIYGPFDAATKPLFDCFRAGFAPRLGAAAARFSMVYVDDAATAVLAAADGASSDAAAYEFDDGAGGHDWAGVRLAAEAAMGRRLRLLPVPDALLRLAGGVGSAVAGLGLATPFLTTGKVREMRAGDWIADMDRAPPNWSPEVSLQSGFSRTLACYRERRR